MINKFDELTRSLAIGEYFGLANAGSDFVSARTQVDQDNVTAIFFRRISN